MDSLFWRTQLACYLSAKTICTHKIDLHTDLITYNYFQGKLSETWTDVTKAAIGEAILAVTKMEESLRQNQAFMKTPTVSFLSTERVLYKCIIPGNLMY